MIKVGKQKLVGYKLFLLETCFVETAPFRVCPREGLYGILVTSGFWHSVVVHEVSTILEAKDGKYRP